jgi:uncharacterized membrane protein YgdD (TMEM256/DUF423 family)
LEVTVPVNIDRILIAVGAGSARVAVAAGAFGAHLLRTRLGTDLLAVFETGARYQMYHALALIAVGLALGRGAGQPAVWAGWLFVAGSIIFSGSLYALAVTGARWWGAITPFGGVCFLLGWALFAWSMWRPSITQ